MVDKPLVTVSGKKILFKSALHQRMLQDLPQEGVEWRRRLDSHAKFVYIDVDFVDFDIDDVERSSERLSKLSLISQPKVELDNKDASFKSSDSIAAETTPVNEEPTEPKDVEPLAELSIRSDLEYATSRKTDDSHVFFNQKLLGRPILHTYWADKTDIEGENQKSQFDEWIGRVQASSCTEWAIIIIEDGDFKAQIGTALFKSKLQSTASQTSMSSTNPNLSQNNSVSLTPSFLERMKKGLSTIFQNDSNSGRWLTLVNQDRLPDARAQESYANFIKKFRNVAMASFSKQIELFEEQLRVQREMRVAKNWNFFSYFSMQEELAFAFESLTLFDDALVQYDLLDALFTEYISSPTFNGQEEPLYSSWTSFKSWQGLCLDLNCEHSVALRTKIVEKSASLLEIRNYLFAKQCDLMLMQNQPWRVAASTILYLQNCIREHEFLNIDVVPGALTTWSFVSALEVLQKCECYSCTSTMENYSLHTVDIWNYARRSLLELGRLTKCLFKNDSTPADLKLIQQLLKGLEPDPHGGTSYQNNELSPQARLRDALSSTENFSRQFVEISELTIGTYRRIGRKRQALFVGRELANFYITVGEYEKALPFLVDLEKCLDSERWYRLLEDVRASISKCNKNMDKNKENEAVAREISV